MCGVHWVALLFLYAAVVQVHDNEVWLDGKQLTRDGKTKYQAVMSPARDRIAYYEGCPQGEHCLPAIVILDLAGVRQRSFQVLVEGQACASILGIDSPAPDLIAAECHSNPSLSYYVEMRASDGSVLRTLMGYRFSRSPDGSGVAHVGWIIHFAPPYVQSEYLKINEKIVYPLPRGMKPVEQKGLEMAPNVVRERGHLHSGIHRFPGEFVWSPDSQRVAFVDCTYDWTDEGNGKESNHRCSAVAVSVDGRFTTRPAGQDAKVSWSGGEVVVR